MLVEAARVGEAGLAAEIAVVLTERGLGGDAVDLTRRIESFRRDRSPRAEDARRLARNLAQRALALALTPTLSRDAGEGGNPSPACGRRWPAAADRMRARAPTSANGSPPRFLTASRCSAAGAASS